MPKIDVAITAPKPLPISKTRVKNARPFLPVRRTLVAPILPDPISLRFEIPPSLVNTSPNGIEPKRYDKSAIDIIKVKLSSKFIVVS
jgi:hypothetical protein